MINIKIDKKDLENLNEKNVKEAM
jgi:hypothetical protein